MLRQRLFCWVMIFNFIFSSILAAQDANLCQSCLRYEPLITAAIQRGEIGAIKGFRSEIESRPMEDVDKAHLLAYLQLAEQAIVGNASSITTQPSGTTTRFVSTLDSDERATNSDRKTAIAAPKPSGTSKPSNASFRKNAGSPSQAVSDPQPKSNSPTPTIPRDLLQAYRDAGYTIDQRFNESANAAPITAQPIPQQIPKELRDAYEKAGYTLSVPANPQPTKPLFTPFADPVTPSSSLYPLPNEASSLFFFFEGMTSTCLVMKPGTDPNNLSVDTVQTAEFADQTLHMGQALVTFAIESSILKKNNLDNSGSEAVLKSILAAFNELDAADTDFYGASVPGFFIRDLIHNDKRRGVPGPWNITSDSKDTKEGGPIYKPAMSIDQTTSLFVGWWAVAKYSSDNDNVTKAKQQCESVMQFLADSLFFIKLPNGDGIPTARGPEFRYAAGFICRMADAITGRDYYSSSDVDVTIKGDPIRFRDDNLGEFEIPGYKIPAKMPVKISHPAILGLTPVALVGMTAPPRIKIRFTDLFNGANPSTIIPCMHLVKEHPDGHTNMFPCVHLTVTHSDGDLVSTLPCAHMVPEHSGGHSIPCVHMTAAHPGGHDGPTLPCAHIVKLHGSHRVSTPLGSVNVPCTHFGPEHPGGHTQTIPCVHLVPEHPAGHSVPCLHMTAEHPSGHAVYSPCIHPTAVHPAGDPVKLPCLHIGAEHPGGDTIDLASLDIDVPLGEKIHSYSRHIMLQCLAFDSGVRADIEMLPVAQSSQHLWSALLREAVFGDVSNDELKSWTKVELDSLPSDLFPTSKSPKPWAKTNRWERCTDLEPNPNALEAYNGLDYLSLELLAKANGL